MEKGDVLLIEGHRYIVRGLDPSGTTPRLVYLEHQETGARSIIGFEEIAPHMLVPRLRLIRGDG